MKKHPILFIFLLTLLSSCTKEDTASPAGDTISVIPTVEESVSSRAVHLGSAFNKDDQVSIYAISRPNNSGGSMPQSEATSSSTSNTFYWYNATGTYTTSQPGSPFDISGVGATFSSYANVPGEHLDFYAKAPASVPVSLKTLDEMNGPNYVWPAYSPQYSNNKSLWITVNNTADLSSNQKSHNDPIDYMYAVDGESYLDKPIVGKKKQPVSMRFKHALSLVEIKIFRNRDISATLTKVAIKPWQRAIYIRVTDGAIAAWGNGWGDGIYYCATNLNIPIPEGRDNAIVLPNKFVLCPNVGDNTPSLAYVLDEFLGNTSTQITTIETDGKVRERFIQYGADKTILKPGYKYLITIEIASKNVTANITIRPWISEGAQSIIF